MSLSAILGNLMKAIIYQPTKNAMQSGRGKSNIWKISLEENEAKFIDPLMGWVGMSDMASELNLTFDSLELAKSYAKKHKLDYSIIKPKQRNITPKSYAGNFSYDKISF